MLLYGEYFRIVKSKSHMRTKVLLILLSVILSSCGNEDSSEVNVSATLIGQWQITQRTIDGNDNGLYECEPYSVYTYRVDGTYSELHYAADVGTECLDNPSIEFTGTWQVNSESNYSFTNANDETSEVFIVFDSNNSFTAIVSQLSNPIDPVIQTVAERFIRIE